MKRSTAKDGPSRLRSVAGATLLMIAASMLGCPAPLGGWDVARLLREEPAVATLRDQRLGDLSPYPLVMSDGESLGLMTCRWAATSPVRVRIRLNEERAEWARRGIESLKAGTPSLDLVILASDVPSPAGLIEVVEIFPSRGEGPVGVGDTFVTCAASSGRSKDGDRRAGTLLRAEIRMRAQVWDQLDEPVALSAEDWTGAFMHELGHALGFQGHLRAGESILVRDQDRLRRAGRKALAGEAWRDESLEALYRLDAGRLLGQRSLSTRSARWLKAVEARVGSNGEGPFARVGDRHGELEWITEDGTSLKLHFPFWSRQLRNGDELIGVPPTTTREWLARPRAVASP